jgi:hypothetical protein
MPEPQVYGFVDPATGQVHVADTQAEVLAYQAKGWTLGSFPASQLVPETPLFNLPQFGLDLNKPSTPDPVVQNQLAQILDVQDQIKVNDEVASRDQLNQDYALGESRDAFNLGAISDLYNFQRQLRPLYSASAVTSAAGGGGRQAQRALTESQAGYNLDRSAAEQGYTTTQREYNYNSAVNELARQQRERELLRSVLLTPDEASSSIARILGG